MADADFVVPVPDAVSSFDAAPLTCAGVTTYKAIKVARVRPAEKVAIFGVGGLGHLAVQYARLVGGIVIAVDVDDTKLELARQLGADHTVNAATSDPVAAIEALGGIDVAVVTAVIPAVFEQAFAALRRGGRLVCVGLPPETDGPMSLPIFPTVLKGISVIGSIVGTRQDLAEVFDLHAHGRTKVIAESRKLDEVNESIDDVLDGPRHRAAGLRVLSARWHPPGAGRRTSWIDLYWLPLGAGGRVVPRCGRAFERLSAAREHRAAQPLFHSALEVADEAPGYVDRDGSGLVQRGPGARRGRRGAGRPSTARPAPRLPVRGALLAGRPRSPTWPGRSESPQRLTDDAAVAARVLAQRSVVPALTWGRDELGLGRHVELQQPRRLAAVHLRSGRGAGVSRRRAVVGRPAGDAGLALAGGCDRAVVRGGRDVRLCPRGDLDEDRDMTSSRLDPASAPPATGSRCAARALHAHKVYGDGETAVVALDDLSLDLPVGEFTAIMGPSGSGKSTLMHCLAGLDTLTSGQVLVGDTDLATLSDRERTLLRRDRLGFVFQSFNLLPTLTAEENITAARRPGRPDPGPRRGWRPSSRRSTSATGWSTGPPSCPVASSSASPSPARSSTAPTSSSRTSPRARWTPRPGPSSCASCGPWWTSWGRPSSW